MIRKFTASLLLTLLISAIFIRCSRTDDDTTSATVTALDCSSVTYSATATANTAYSGTATVPYTGGNGVAYSAGSAISSTGVTGLTATLVAGTLASGSGSLTYTISGTPADSGTALFAISFGGQSCSLSLTVSGTSTTADCSSSTGVAKVVCLANAFLSTLTSDQQSSVVLTLNLENAKRWSNLPCALSCRNGLLFGDLTTAQQTAALAVIKAAAGTASGEAYDEFEAIRAADDYLNTSGGGSSYGDGNYVIAFLGTPSTTGKWMLQYGGHHFASNITYNAGSVVSITPLHEGVEPHGSFTVNDTTYECPLASELSGVQTMLGSFTSSELSSAKISSTFSDCLMVPGSTTNTFPTTKQGIQVSSLSTTAQANVWAAIQPWINDIDSAQAATIREAYSDELSDTYVCYASNTSATAGDASSFFTTNTDYVRIDGPSIWIEFICQTGVVFSSAIHYHTVMRDHERDYLDLE
ncbi:DUF3500 domain-containing protein [Parafilimonas sp.]|uniref:DUF3500 domain-containing protein n=1 Tax=Parafilimonas sp. TaxID=1969739 RepID=UPI0039E2CA73